MNKSDCFISLTTIFLIWGFFPILNMNVKNPCKNKYFTVPMVTKFIIPWFLSHTHMSPWNCLVVSETECHYSTEMLFQLETWDLAFMQPVLRSPGAQPQLLLRCWPRNSLMLAPHFQSQSHWGLWNSSSSQAFNAEYLKNSLWLSSTSPPHRLQLPRWVLSPVAPLRLPCFVWAA